VSVLIFLLVPEHATQQHLEILSEVAEMLSDSSLRDSLMQSPTPEALFQSLSSWKPSGS
jgi:PTS system nitrogen regulatory IIA component